MEKYIDFAFDAYENHHVNNRLVEDKQKGYYRQEGNTPFITHPVFAASLLLADRRVPQKQRELGYKILILHDILEDTDVELPDWVEKEVASGVKVLTHTKEEEGDPNLLRKKIEGYAPFHKLLLLCDMLSNMYEEHVSEQKRSLWKQGVSDLVSWLEKDYANSRVLQVAKTIIESTAW